MRILPNPTAAERKRHNDEAFLPLAPYPEPSLRLPLCPMHRSYLLHLCLSILLASLVAACSSTHQIQTAPPRPAVALSPDTVDATPRALLSVVVQTGTTALPDDVAGLRLRIAEIRLKPTNGTWTNYPADLNQFEWNAQNRPRRTILSTHVPATAYDSVAVVLGDLYLTFDANAGGPLTTPREAPARLPLAWTLREDRAATLRLTFEPGASLMRTRDCHWIFTPFFQAAVE